MTVIDCATGEVAHLTEAEARRLTERIRITATNARDSLTKLQELVEEARQGQAHVALGYRSWTAYLADVFGDAPMLLPRDERREVVQWLASEGMGSRAIAPAVGITDRRVRQIVSEVGNDFPPEPQAPRGAAVPSEPENAFRPAGEVERDTGAATPVASRPVNITGMDGKTYTRPAPHAEPTPAAPQVITSREFKPEPKPGTDLHALRHVVIPALNAWADEWTHKTLLDNTVTAEEAAQLLRDLSRTTPVLSQIRRLLNSRTESIK